MSDRTIQVIYGEGRGKTSAAVGQSIQALSNGKSVVFIRFLKGKNLSEYSCLEKLEPDIKVFCFEKETAGADLLYSGVSAVCDPDAGDGVLAKGRNLQAGSTGKSH